MSTLTPQKKYLYDFLLSLDIKPEDIRLVGYTPPGDYVAYLAKTEDVDKVNRAVAEGKFKQDGTLNVIHEESYPILHAQ